LPFPENQISKGRPAGFVEAGNLAIEHCTLYTKMLCDPDGKFGKAAGTRFRFSR
jgi:hypothetical protein